MYKCLTRKIAIPTSIKVGALIFLISITAILLFFGQHFGFHLTPLRLITLLIILGCSCLSLILLPINIIINKFNREKFERDYSVIIKCKNCGSEFRKTECPSYCPECNEFLRPEFVHIIMGSILIAFTLWIAFFLLDNFAQAQNLHIFFFIAMLFVIGGVTLILYGTGHATLKGKTYPFLFGLIPFLMGSFLIFGMYDFSDFSLIGVLMGIIFIIVGIGIMSGKVKLMTEEQVTENLPRKGIGGFFKKLFEFKNRKKY